MALSATLSRFIAIDYRPASKAPQGFLVPTVRSGHRMAERHVSGYSIKLDSLDSYPQ